MPTRVLFVCLGNICRSPSAEAVMRHLVAEAGMSKTITVDSAGTGAWHIGEQPDRRARAAAAHRGIAMSGAARQIEARDFDHFDLVVAMDGRNLHDLRQLAPPGTAQKVRVLGPVDVPDPYYGDAADFDEVLDIVAAGCRDLLDELRQG